MSDIQPAVLVLPNGHQKLAGELTENERNDLMLDSASMDRATMRLHLRCSLKCPINGALLASKRIPAAA